MLSTPINRDSETRQNKALLSKWGKLSQVSQSVPPLSGVWYQSPVTARDPRWPLSPPRPTERGRRSSCDQTCSQPRDRVGAEDEAARCAQQKISLSPSPQPALSRRPPPFPEITWCPPPPAARLRTTRQGASPVPEEAGGGVPTGSCVGGWGRLPMP